MHPEVTSDPPDRCPQCGMKLVPAALGRGGGGPRGRPARHEDAHQHDHATRHGHAHEAGGIEWEDDMVEVNRMTTPANTRWKLIDRATGRRAQRSTGASASATR